jgi:c-di-GMP-binding flagellar brake protein YcgR
MSILSKQDDKIIRLVTQEAQKFQAKVKEIDLENQTLDIDCPDENKAECAIAIHKILVQNSKRSK